MLRVRIIFDRFWGWNGEKSIYEKLCFMYYWCLVFYGVILLYFFILNILVGFGLKFVVYERCVWEVCFVCVVVLGNRELFIVFIIFRVGFMDIKLLFIGFRNRKVSR